MKIAKGWRKLKKELQKPTITKEELYEYLNAMFFNRTYPEYVKIEPTYFVTEEGVEMVQLVSPIGIMQTRADKWHNALEEQCKTYITLDPSYYKSNPITSTKVTLDHGIEVTITYDDGLQNDL